MESFFYSVLLPIVSIIIPTTAENVEVTQSIAVRGQVKCALRDVINTLVKLGIDIRFVDEQILALAKTNTTGWFELKATVISESVVRPFYQIYADQSSGIKCRQRYKQSIPEEFISRWNEPERWFNAGIIDLQNICSQEPNETSCLGQNDFFAQANNIQQNYAGVIF